MTRGKKGTTARITDRVAMIRRRAEFLEFKLNEPEQGKRHMLRKEHYCTRWAADVLEQAHREHLLEGLTERADAHRLAEESDRQHQASAS